MTRCARSFSLAPSSRARLDSTAWTAVDNDGVVPIAGDAFIQYQLTPAGDGWTFPSVDRVELDYH